MKGTRKPSESFPRVFGSAFEVPIFKLVSGIWNLAKKEFTLVLSQFNYLKDANHCKKLGGNRRFQKPKTKSVIITKQNLNHLMEYRLQKVLLWWGFECWTLGMDLGRMLSWLEFTYSRVELFV